MMITLMVVMLMMVKMIKMIKMSMIMMINDDGDYVVCYGDDNNDDYGEM